MSVIFDLIHFATGVDIWAWSSFWMMEAGIIGGLVAALFGLLEWTKIPLDAHA